MSPLNTTQSVPVYDNTKKNSTTDINIVPMEPKIIYQRSEMEQLRYASNTPLNIKDNPQLELVARINFMPQFAVNLMPNHVPTPDGRNAHVNRRHVPHANGHDFSSSNSRSMNRESSINQRLSRIQISIPREVKLNKAENAWKPSVMKKNDPKDVKDDDGIEELLRGVRSILNKLTTTNFDVMLDQFQDLNIDTADKVNAVTSMVFLKAVNEPNFSTGYAVLCKHLSVCLAQDDTERSQFKRSLILKCQHEFVQNVADTKAIDRELQPLKDKLKACPLSDIEEINNIKINIVEEESNIRRRLVSTVRFIGELYKMDMLTTNIMSWCIKSLVDSGTEDKLECLCKLLTTIGAKLETKPTSDKDQKRYLNLTEYFKQLKKIVDRKVPKVNVSTRIRFMIMDLIDLRNLNWKPKITARN